MYGERVSVEYHDMAVPGKAEQMKDLLETVPKNRLYYPLVFVNGQFKVAGSAEYYQVLYAVRDLVDA